MSLCAVKRGIITLRDCGQEASDSCATCARAVCREHMKVSAGTVLCVECYARREEEALKEATKGAKGGKGAAGGKTPTTRARTAGESEEWDDPTWPYSYRHNYYMTSHYMPFYSGGYYDNYYDTYDVRSFHHGSHGESMYDEGEGVGDFNDS